MQWWMLGAGLAALLALSAWDVGRPGRAEPAALLLLRAVGGLGLVALAALALEAGSDAGALVAGAAAVPLLAGMLSGALREPRRAAARRPAELVRAATAEPPAAEAPDGERRAA